MMELEERNVCDQSPPRALCDVRTEESKKLTPAAGHISVALGDKLVLVWGGYFVVKSSNQFGRADRYRDPEQLYVYHTTQRKWLVFQTTGRAPPKNSGCCSVVVGLRLFIFGGFLHRNDNEHNTINASRRLFCLNLRTLEWSEVSPRTDAVPTPRHKLVGWEYENKLCFFGGFGPSPQALSSNMLAQSSTPFLNENGLFCDDQQPGYMPSSWNNQLVVFDLKHHVWSNPKCTGEIPCPRAAHATTNMCFDKILLFGGRHQTSRLNDLHILNMKNLNWTKVSISNDLSPVGRSWHCMAQVAPNHYRVYGGFSQDNKPLADCWLLDTSGLQWVWKEEKQFQCDKKRLWHTGVSVDGALYVYGGCQSNILDMRETRKYCNDLLIIPQRPDSLTQMCVSVVSEHKSKLSKAFTLLPQHLVHKIEFRAQKSFKKSSYVKLYSVADLFSL